MSLNLEPTARAICLVRYTRANNRALDQAWIRHIAEPYVERHWREYLPDAEAAAEALGVS